MRWHLGLGDHLLCNGLVRVLVKRGMRLMLPCYQHNLASLEAMFNDIKESVEFRVVAELSGWDGEVINLGYYGSNFDTARWDESFYRQAGVPFLSKWEEFKFGVFTDWVTTPPPKVFIHDDASRGFVIPIEGHRPDRITELSGHYSDLRNAKEIHCINSSFAILADLINAPGRKVLHRYARPDGGVLPIYGRDWEIREKP